MVGLLRWAVGLRLLLVVEQLQLLLVVLIQAKVRLGLRLGAQVQGRRRVRNLEAFARSPGYPFAAQLARFLALSWGREAALDDASLVVVVFVAYRARRRGGRTATRDTSSPAGRQFARLGGELGGAAAAGWLIKGLGLGLQGPPRVDSRVGGGHSGSRDRRSGANVGERW